MPRIKRGTTVKKKHKKLKALTKGYIKSRRSSVKRAKEAVMKAGVYAYRDRRAKKREFRRLWIIRINAGLKTYNLRYSEFIKKLKDKKIELDRKILSQLAKDEPEVFEEIVNKVK